MTNSGELRAYESVLLNLLLAGDLPILGQLRSQLAGATVKSRDFSGVGSFTHFAITPGAPQVTPPNFELGDVAFELTGVRHGADAILFVRNGYLDLLEVVMNDADQAWPSEPHVHSATYVRRTGSFSSPTARGRRTEPSDTRDLAALAQLIGSG